MITFTNRLSTAIAILPLGIVGFASPIDLTDTDWVLADSPEMLIMTNATPRIAIQAFERFEILNQFVAKELGIHSSENGRKQRPHYVIIPRSKDLFDKLAPFQSQHHASQASGFYIKSDFNPLVLVDSVTSSENWETVYHEFTHRILNVHFDDLPTWADEGLAELFSTIRLSKTDAQLTRSRGRTSRYEASLKQFIDWESFFATSRATLASWIENDGLRAQAYYAQAALLAELTHFGDPVLKNGYWELVERSSYKPITELDYQILLGLDFSQLQDAIGKQLQKSFSRTITRTDAQSQPSRLFEGREDRLDPPKFENGGLSQSSLPKNPVKHRGLGAEANKTGPIRIHSASPSSIAAILAIALTRANKTSEAQTLVGENTDPENPLWLAANSEVSVKLGNTAAALDYAGRALQHSHSDPFLVTLSVMRSVNEERLVPEIALASLTRAYQQGDSSRLLFNLYFEISRNESIPFRRFAPLAKRGIAIHPDIEYAQEFNRMETERIFGN